MYRLLCMAFDGQSKLEAPEFEDAEDVWSYADYIGSKWFFYPFYFVVTASGKTIVETPRMLEFLEGRRVKSVIKFFNKTSKLEDAEGADCDKFISLLLNGGD